MYVPLFAVSLHLASVASVRLLRTSSDVTVALCRLTADQLTFTRQWCDLNPASLLAIPAVALKCSARLSAATVVDIFMNRQQALLDASSAAAFSKSLTLLPTPLSLTLSFGVCGDARVPSVVSASSDFLLAVVLNHAAEQRPPPVAYQTAVFFFPVTFLFDPKYSHLPKQLFAALDLCDSSSSTSCGVDQQVALFKDPVAGAQALVADLLL